jgi:hypothetical protein
VADDLQHPGASNVMMINRGALAVKSFMTLNDAQHLSLACNATSCVHGGS